MSTGSESSTPPFPDSSPNITGLQQNLPGAQSLHWSENKMYTDPFHTSPQQLSRPRSVSQGSGCSKYSDHSQGSNLSLQSFHGSQPNLADSQTSPAQSESGYSEYPAFSDNTEYPTSSGYASSYSTATFSRFHSSSEYPASSGYCDSKSCCSSGYSGSASFCRMPSNQQTLDNLQIMKRVQEWVDTLPKNERKHLDMLLEEHSLQGQCSNQSHESHHRNQSHWSCESHCSNHSAAETVNSDCLVQHPSAFSMSPDATSCPPCYFRPAFNRQDGIPSGTSDNVNSEFPFYGDDNMSEFFQEHPYDSPMLQRQNPPLQNIFPNVTVTGSEANSQLSFLQGETDSHLLRVTPKHQSLVRRRSISQDSEHSNYSEASNRSNLTQHHRLPEPASIRDELLMTVVNCLMHHPNCQIPNCPCKSLQDRYRKLFHHNPSYVPQQHVAETCKRENGPNADPRESKHQLDLTLSNLTTKTHPHYHLTNKSHICRVTKPPLLCQRSKECDLTPRSEIAPDFPQAAADDSSEDKRFNSDQTYEDSKPPLLLREISISAENIPALCLNDCPLMPTPLRKARTLSSSPMHLKPRHWAMHKTTLKTVKEDSQSTDSLETNESNTSSQSSSVEEIASVSDGELQPATAKQTHSGSFASSHYTRRGKSVSLHHHPSRSKQGSPTPSRYTRGKSGYDSTAESTLPVHRYGYRKSGYESNQGHSNSGQLLRKPCESKLQKQAEIGVVPCKYITETLV